MGGSSRRNMAALSGKTICFTGKLEKPRKECEAIAVAAGAKILSGVSKNLNILVAGPGAGSKAEKAESLGTDVWDEAKFMSNASGSGGAKKATGGKKRAAAPKAVVARATP